MSDFIHNPIVNTIYIVLVFLIIIAAWIKVVQMWIINIKSKDKDQLRSWFWWCLGLTVIVALITYFIWPL